MSFPSVILAKKEKELPTCRSKTPLKHFFKPDQKKFTRFEIHQTNFKAPITSH
jgi:hypothetical protein